MRRSVAGVHDVADALDQLPDGSSVVRVIELSGFGSRRGGEAVAISPGGEVVAGRLLAGLVDGALRAHAGRTGEVRTAVTDPEAEAAGMACGGEARLLVQPVDSVPPDAWAALRDRRGVVVATALDSAATRCRVDGSTPVGTTGLDDAAIDQAAARLLRGGRSTVEEVDGVLLESFLPPTTVRIVGRAAVGDALAAQAELLGWRAEVVDGAEAGAGAGRVQASHDALVVLSHDEAVDTPSLAAALEHGRGYVGALGSRGTQAARRARLADLGVPADRIASIHGPVGLDLGSRTPEETAVAIVAEIIAHRSGRDATSLAAGRGPING